jgi:hypothetical protein
MSAAQRALLLGLAVIFGLNALIKLALIWFSLKLPLEISMSGIAVEGMKISCGAVEGCRWARYPPDTLEVRMHLARDYFQVPRNQRAAVEAALRKVGNWQC